jgi:ribosomal protein S18 acetylase RimI-like enzyme
MVLLTLPGTMLLRSQTSSSVARNPKHQSKGAQHKSGSDPSGITKIANAPQPPLSDQRNSPVVDKSPVAKPSEPSIWTLDRIALWTMIGTAVTALATGAQAGVTYLIARSIAKASGVSESLQISREIDRIWQDFNRQAIVNEDFRNTIRSLESLSEAPETTQLRHLIFYLLNIIYISWTAQREKRDTFDHSQTIVKDHLAVLYSKRELVLSILNGHRGYNKIFVQDCTQAFAQMDREHGISDEVSEIHKQDFESLHVPDPPAVVQSTTTDIPNTPVQEDKPMIEPNNDVETGASTVNAIQPKQDHSEATGAVAQAKQPLIIRFARPDEWQVVQALNLQIFQFELEHCEPTSNLEYPFSTEGEDYFKKAAQQGEGHVAIVAELEGAVVGYVIVKKIADSDLTHRVGVVQYQLHTLSVDKDHRDKGIGGALVEAAKAYAKDQGANRIKVVAYSGNDRADHLYKAKGFVVLETTYEAKL